MRAHAFHPWPAEAEHGDEETRAIPPRAAWRGWLQSPATAVLLADLALFGLFGWLSVDHVFWTSQNVTNLLMGMSESLLLALGLAMLLGAGVFDLSLGANLVLSSVIGARVMDDVSGTSLRHPALSIALGLGACLGAGAAFGLVNGFIIAYLDVNSLIGTLGTLGIGTGIALLMTNGADLSGVPPQVQQHFGLAMVWIVPVPALVALGLAVVLWAVVRFTRFGLETIAIGSSRVSATRSGLHVRHHLVKLAILAGTLAGLAGFFDLARYLGTSVNGHSQDALAAFTAVIIGGTRLNGGRISITGVVWGSALAVILLSGLVVIGAQSFWQLIVIGGILIIVVAVDRARARRLEQS